MIRMTIGAATSDKGVSATIYIAIELSGSKWVIGVHTPLADKIQAHLPTRGWRCPRLAEVNRSGAGEG